MIERFTRRFDMDITGKWCYNHLKEVQHLSSKDTGVKWDTSLLHNKMRVCKQLVTHQQVKTIFQPWALTDRFHGAHDVSTLEEHKIRWPIRGEYAIRLIHFQMKTFPEFLDRQTKSRHAQKFDEDYESWFDCYNVNDVYDAAALRYLPLIKALKREVGIPKHMENKTIPDTPKKLFDRNLCWGEEVDEFSEW